LQIIYKWQSAKVPLTAHCMGKEFISESTVCVILFNLGVGVPGMHMLGPSIT